MVGSKFLPFLKISWFFFDKRFTVPGNFDISSVFLTTMKIIWISFYCFNLRFEPLLKMNVSLFSDVGQDYNLEKILTMDTWKIQMTL